MIQLLEKKTGTRIIVFTLLLTILAWLVPSNIREVQAETIDEPSTTAPLEQIIMGGSFFYKTYGDSAFSLEASAPGRLSYESNNPRVATVSTDGWVTINGVGTATITITAAATDRYQVGTRTATIIVEKQAQTISVASAFNKTYGVDTSFYLDATAEGELRCESSNPKVAKVISSDGWIEITGVGTAILTIKAAETSTYAAATKTVLLTVGKGGQVIKGETNFEAVYGAEPFNLNQRAEGTLTYESKNPEVVTVSADGTVTIIGAGTAEIQITAVATANYEAQQKIVRITVEKGKQTISGPSIFTKNYGNSSFSLGASAEGELSYESSNPSVVSVSSSGTVTIKGLGTATITITAAETDKYQQATKQVKITVKVQKPKTVAIKSAKSSKEGQLTVAWKKVSGVSGYQVVLGKNKSCTSGKKVKTVSSKASSVTVKILAKGTTYYAKVRAYKTISGKKYYGNYSKVKSAKTKGKKPLPVAQLKKYRNKSFYTTPFDEDKEFVMIEFDKISGKTVKFKLKHGNAWYLNDNVTGKLVGNQIRFTIKNWYSTVYVNDTVGFKDVKTRTKTKGIITLVDNKTIKLQITSRKDSNNFLKTGEYKNSKMLYPKKIMTMKNISVAGHGF